MRLWTCILAVAACGFEEPEEIPAALAQRELDDRIDHVLSLSGDPGDGELVYVDHCVGCHRESGLGRDDPDDPGIGANLWNAAEDPGRDPELVETILSGPLAMPPFADVLTDREIADVLAYIHEDLFE